MHISFKQKIESSRIHVRFDKEKRKREKEKERKCKFRIKKKKYLQKLLSTILHEIIAYSPEIAFRD